MSKCGVQGRRGDTVRKAVAVVSALALALALVPTVAFTQQAQAADAISALFMVVKGGAYYSISPNLETTNIDNRDELNVSVEVPSVASDQNYGKATLWLRPVGGGSDIKVFKGASDAYGGALLGFYTHRSYSYEDDATEERPGVEVSASFALIDMSSGERVAPGEYKAVVDLQTRASTRDAWSSLERYVAPETVPVVQGDDVKPLVGNQYLPTALIEEEYRVQLEAQPSVAGHTLVFEEVRNASGELGDYGLSLAANGEISGTATAPYSGGNFTMFAKVTEMDGDVALGSTERAYNLRFIDRPYIDTASVGVSRGEAGIVPGSQLNLQVQLSESSGAKKGAATLHYRDSSDTERELVCELALAEGSSTVYEGALALPEGAAYVDNVVFDAASMKAREDKTCYDCEGNVASLFSATLDGALDASASTPYLVAEQLDDSDNVLAQCDPLYFEGDSLQVTTLEEGNYRFTLGAYVNGEPVEYAATAVTAELKAGVPAAATFDASALVNVKPQVDVSEGIAYAVEWYADAEGAQRVGTSLSRGWDGVSDLYVRAVPRTEALVTYAPSELVKVTEANASSLELAIPERVTCVVRGTVTQSPGGSTAFDAGALQVSLTVLMATDASRTWTTEVGSDGSYVLEGIPAQAQEARLMVCGRLFNTAQADITLDGAVSVTQDMAVSERQGIIVLQEPVDFASVNKDGEQLSAHLSADGMLVYLDDPSAVSENDELDVELFCGSSADLYGGGVIAWCQTKTAKLNANKNAPVASQNMQRLGGFKVNLSNQHSKIFSALIIKDTDDGEQAIVRVDTGTERSGLGTSASQTAYVVGSLPAGTYRVLFAERDSLMQLSTADRLTPTRVKAALDRYGTGLYLETDAFSVSEDEVTELPDTALPDAKPDKTPIDAEKSSMQVVATGSSLVYRAVVAKGEAALPQGQDLNLIVSTSQDSSAENTAIAGSVVYINGHAAKARSTTYADSSSGEVYLFPNSIRNDHSGSAGMYVVTIPADELDKYGGFDTDKPLRISFTAPRATSDEVFASATVAFGNINWQNAVLSASTIVDKLERSTHYLTQRSTSVAGTKLTCFVPANVSKRTFSVYGTAPTGTGVDHSADIYLDGVKAARVPINQKTGRYDAQLELVTPNDYSKHTVSAQVGKSSGAALQSAAGQLVYSPRMAALATIEVSDYHGTSSWVKCWENGRASIGSWYYLPDVKTRYRLTFKKGTASAVEGDVSDVYVNVPYGTGTLRLKAVYDSGGHWLTDEVAMGNTPPSGEWVTYNPTIPITELAADEASRMGAELGKLDGYTPASAERVAAVNAQQATTQLALSADGKTATFEGVEVVNEKQTSASTSAWVNALPESPWKDGLTDAQKGALYEKGYLSTLTTSVSDSITDDDARVDAVSVGADADATTIYQRIGLVDNSWDKLPDGFSTSADAGAAITDSISRYAYTDGSGAYVYTRVTATRNKYAKTVCDTKTNTIYTTTYTATSGNTVADTSDDLDGDGVKGALNDKLFAIGDGWATFQRDLANLSNGIVPQVNTSGSGVQGTSATKKAAGPLRESSNNTTYSWQDPKDPNFVNASYDEVLDAMARWVLINSRNSGDASDGFDVWCLSGDNGRWSNGVGDRYDWMNSDYTVRSGIDQRVLTYLGASKTRQLEKEVAKEAVKLAAGQVVEGEVVDTASDVLETASDVYSQHTSMSERDSQIEDLRRELYYAAISYNKSHPDTPLNMEGFPFGSNLPDPRQKQKEQSKPRTEEDVLKMIKEWEEEEQKNWPSVEDYEKKWKQQLDELEANSVKNVPNSDSMVPVIDPSGYVYAGVEDNRLEGVQATLFEVADGTGARTQWDADAYGQSNPYTTDAQGHYEWFVPEGKWSITFVKDGYRSYTTGPDDGIDTAWEGDTWYMPVAPAQLDVNIGLAPTAAPEVESVTWTKKGVEILFTQVMDEDSLDGALQMKRNGSRCDFTASYDNVRLDAADDTSPLVTKATLVLGAEPVESDAFVLDVRQWAENYAHVALKASCTKSFVAPAAVLQASTAQQARQTLQQVADVAAGATSGIVVSTDGADVDQAVSWAPQSAFDALQEAAEAAGVVLNSDEATADQLERAVGDLQDALAAFRAACKAGSKGSSSGGSGSGSSGSGGSGSGGSGSGSSGANAGGTSGGSTAPAKATVKAGKSYAVGTGAKAAYYQVKKVATKKAAGTVWYAKPKSPKKVKTLSIPATVKIGGLTYKVVGVKAKALSKCTKLTKATIGSNVASVGKNAFKGCKKLKTVTVKSAKLSKASCKNLVKGTKIANVKLKGAAKKAKVKKKYKKYFPKKNAGKKLKLA